MSGRAELLERLDAVEERLAARASLDVRADALTDAEPGSGERWDAGQVWAHLAEFVPYWIDQLSAVAAAGTEDAIAFGRTRTDPGRIGAIARDRDQPLQVLWSDTHSDIEHLRRFIETLDEGAWSARGLHPTLGVMSMDRMLEQFLVGHLEEHADQLDLIARQSR